MSSLVINNTGSVLSTKPHLESDESGFVYAIASQQYSRHLITTKAGEPAAILVVAASAAVAVVVVVVVAVAVSVVVVVVVAKQQQR